MHPDTTTITIYTDGSGIENNIGAAAYNSATNEVSHQHLGSEAQFNVYTAELTAMNLAVKQMRHHSEYQIGRIYTDSQARVRAIDHPRRQSGQTIIKDILDNIDEIVNNTQLQIEIMWIPGHAEIKGNERADMEAKKAATDSTLRQSHKYKPLKSARARYIKAAAKKQWHTAWRANTKTASVLRRIMEGKYAKTGSTLYNEIENRKDAAKIAQLLQTGHCGLNSYLYRFGKKNSSYCQCGYGKETVEHFLLECRNYREQRKKLRREAGAGKMRTARLLGDQKLIKYTLEYIQATGRLE